MPFPPRTPYLFVCSQCDWRGPIQTGDVLIGPVSHCPDCHAHLSHQHASTLDRIMGLFKKHEVRSTIK